MRKTFLISFCNNKENIKKKPTGYIGMLSIDFDLQRASFEERKLTLPKNIQGNGITGMCLHNGNIVLLLQRKPSTLLFLNDNLNVVDCWPLEKIQGVHSILSKNDDIYLSVTSQDKILKINIDKKIKEIWSKNTNDDTIHLNSICLHKNEIYATAFGQKEKQLWSSAQSGLAFSVKTDKIYINKIWHPHSLFSYKNTLYCCDSSNQRIVDSKSILLAGLPGYSRGMYIDDNLIICGSSQGRLVSHSTGAKISNKSGKGKLAGTCGLTVYFKHQNITTFIPLENIALEIFDILPIISG